MYDCSNIKNYECVYVFDDDCILEKGNFKILENLMLNHIAYQKVDKEGVTN